MLEGFVKDNFDKIFTNWHVVLVDNLSNLDVSSKLKLICNNSRFSYVEQDKPMSLKLNLHLGFLHGVKMMPNPDIIGVFETDLEPNVETITAMKDLILTEIKNGCCSVSPMYKWRESYCYPTHKHWHTDPIYKKNNFGTITKAHAIPFLCSFWEPSHFSKINNKSFREFLHLDTDFGNFLTNKGYFHLRLKDMHAVHTGGGKQSRTGLKQNYKSVTNQRKAGAVTVNAKRRTIKRLRR